MLGEHRGDDFARAIEAGIEEVGIEHERVHLVIRDVASSMKRAMRMLKLESFDCFLHKLNLVRVRSSQLVILQMISGC